MTYALAVAQTCPEITVPAQRALHLWLPVKAGFAHTAVCTLLPLSTPLRHGFTSHRWIT